MALKNRRTQKNKTNRRKQQSKQGGKKIGGNTRKNFKKKRQSRRRRMRGGFDETPRPQSKFTAEVKKIAEELYNDDPDYFCNIDYKTLYDEFNDLDGQFKDFKLNSSDIQRILSHIHRKCHPEEQEVPEKPEKKTRHWLTGWGRR